MKECCLLTDWYLPNANPDMNNYAIKNEYAEIWKDLLEFDKISDDVLVLRDYHAGNLMWLPDRSGVRRVGLLDFQDAIMGSPVYDVVSLLEDARRDVGKEVAGACIKRYLNIRRDIDKEDFFTAFTLLTVQRNCKIAGIFTRLAVRDGKTGYLHNLPRVFQYLKKGLEHPLLKDLQKWFNRYLPQETVIPSHHRHI